MNNVIDLPRFDAKKAVILARVSSKEQEEGHSIEAQKHRLHVYCQRRGLEVLRVFEITESSTRGDRVKFMEMIKFCKGQKQTIAIVADKVDRVQRSFKEYPLLDELVQTGKIELHFNTEGYVIHRESASQERMMWSFNVITAQAYVDSLRDNVKRSFDHKIRSGQYVSRAPLGYLNVRESGKASIIIDAERSLLVRRIFTEFASGLDTVPTITKKAKNWGLLTRSGKSVSKSQMHQLLTNPFYYGIMEVKKKLYPHCYTPLIEKSLFDQCQLVFANWNKKPVKYGEKEFIFRGLVTCKSNGKLVSPITKKKTYLNGETGEWSYLQTWDKDGKFIYVREDKLLKQLEKALEALVIPSDMSALLNQHMKDLNRTEGDYLKRKVEELREEDRKISIRMIALNELLIDGGIPQAEYNTQRTSYRQRQIEIANELEIHRKGDDSFKDALILLLELCNKAPEMFRGSNIAKKRELLNFVFWNLQLDGKTLCFSYRSPFKQYIEGQKEGKWWEWINDLRTDMESRLTLMKLAERIEQFFLAQ